eukprot:3179-Heterococcus_DN1.PRE.7
MYILHYLKKQHCYYTAKALACAAEHCTSDQLYEIWCFGIKGDSSAIASAAKSGDLQKVKLLRNLGIVWDAQTPAFAAAAGHLHIVQYSQCQYSEYPGQIVNLANKCPWNKTTCEAAAVNGYLDILVWAHENGCKWDNKTFTKAAEGGHKHICEYLLAERCPWSYDAREAASREGHTELLQWLIEHGCPDAKRCPDATRRSTRVHSYKQPAVTHGVDDYFFSLCPCVFMSECVLVLYCTAGSSALSYSRISVCISSKAYCCCAATAAAYGSTVTISASTTTCMRDLLQQAVLHTAAAAAAAAA